MSDALPPAPVPSGQARTPVEGWMDGRTHVYPVRVYYEDTDAGGIVYHANYLRFCERARNEMMRCLGHPHAAMVRDDGVAFAVRRCEIDFLRSARLDDALEVATEIIDIGAATVDARQIVRRPEPAGDGPGQGVELARLTLRLACINRMGRPARLPSALRGAMAGIAGMSESPAAGAGPCLHEVSGPA